jgi:hypothetical protein
MHNHLHSERASLRRTLRRGLLAIPEIAEPPRFFSPSTKQHFVYSARVAALTSALVVGIPGWVMGNVG